MAQHEIYLLLRVLPEIYTFWNAATYHFMVILTVALLVGSTWITITEDSERLNSIFPIKEFSFVNENS